MPDTSPFLPHRPGTHWVEKVGKLYRFTTNSIVVIRPWPNPQAWLKHGGKPWRPATPSMNLASPLAQPGAHLRGLGPAYWSRYAEQQAWNKIPDEVRTRVIRAHIAGRQWPVLSMLARCPGAQDLVDTVPVLAAALSVGNRIRPIPVHWPLRSVRALLKTPDGWRRWQRICRWLDLDDSRSFVRMLRRFEMTPYAWPLHRFKSICQAWATPHGKKLLQHAPLITGELGRLLHTAVRENVLEAVSPRLVAETLELGELSGVASTFRDITAMWVVAWDGQPIPTIQSVQRLERMRTETIERILAQRRAHNQASEVLPFPAPPLAPGPCMTPLDSAHALRAEGLDMDHCIGNGSWANQTRRRMGYAYAIHVAGSRATVWIRRDRISPWGFRVEQVRGHRNLPPHPIVVECINQWIRDQAAWALHRLHGGPKPKTPPPPPLPEIWNEPSVPQDVEDALLYEMDDIPF